MYIQDHGLTNSPRSPSLIPIVNNTCPSEPKEFLVRMSDQGYLSTTNHLQMTFFVNFY
jgi:hypothetical protein